LNLVNNCISLFADGDWSEWTPWSGPNEQHTETRTRRCDNPAPANDGQNCTPGINTTVEFINDIQVETETRPVIGKLLFIRRKRN
jgi:hypothetical protein